MDCKLFLNNQNIDAKIDLLKKDKNLFNLIIKAEIKEQVKVEALILKLNLKDFLINYKNSNSFDFNIESILTNGFQSWSKAYEYNIKESQTNIRIRPDLLRFIKSDFEPKIVKNRYFTSNFYMTFLEKIPSQKNITFISKDKVYPTTFIFDKKKNFLEIHFGFDDEIMKGGITLDSIYIIDANNLFELKNSIKILFEGEIFKSYERLKKAGIYDEGSNHVFGWESWYNYYTSITEKEIVKNMDLLNETFKPFNINAKSVFQIDDGWEKRVGVWVANIDKFPTPLENLSKKISEKGLLPGIWMAPLALLKDSEVYKNRYDWVLKDKEDKPISCGNIPLWGGDFYTYDLSIEETQDYIVDEVKKLVERYSFKFLKLDFLYAGLVKGNNKNKDHGVAYYYNIFQNKLIKSLPDDTILLGCGAPIQLSYPFYQIMRIGADTREEWELLIGKIAGYEGRPSAYMSLTDTINRSILNSTVYISDPDVGFFRNSKIKLTKEEKLLVNIIDYILASQFMISDDCDCLDKDLFSEFIIWSRFLNEKKFVTRRFIKKDFYLAMEETLSYLGFFNLSNKDIVITKKDFEKFILKDKDSIERYNLIQFSEKNLKYYNIKFPIIIKKHNFVFLGKNG